MASSAPAERSLKQAAMQAVSSNASLVCAVLFTLIATYPFIFNDVSERQDFFDLQVYFGAVQNWVDTGNLYHWALPPEEIYGFTYPPFAAIAFLPLLVFPSAEFAGPFILLGNVVVMVLVLMLSQRAVGVDFHLRLGIALWVAPLALLLFPIRMNMVMGQTNLVLLLLILADSVLLSGTRFSGIPSAIAASIKMTPALFILYFVAKRDWGGVLRFIATGIAGIALSFIVDFKVALEFFTHTIFESGRVGSIVEPLSYNLLGEFSRVFPPAVAAVLFALGAIGVLVLAYASARYAHLTQQNLVTLCAIGFLTLLVSPISWNHHWVWILPALTAYLAYGIRRADAINLLMFISGVVLFTRFFESWFSGNHWQAGEWPLYAVLMHMLPTLWSIIFIALPVYRYKKAQ